MSDKINEEIVACHSNDTWSSFPRTDAESMIVKAQLAAAIKSILDDKGLTQSRAAAMLGISQPKLSCLLRGQFRSISEAKMLECITRLGRDVHIVINPVEQPNRGHIVVYNHLG